MSLPTLEVDKANHALYGSALSLIGITIASTLAMPYVWLYGILLAALFALLKDVLYDKYMNKGTFDTQDIAVTIYGSVPVSLAVLVVQGI